MSSNSDQFVLRKGHVKTNNETIQLSTISCLPLENKGFKNFFTTRLGGVSPLPKNDLNLAFKDDAVSNVQENRNRFLYSTKLAETPIITAHQTHSDVRATIETIPDNGSPETSADAILSYMSGFLIAVKTADCLPILLGDTQSKAFSAIHSGWRGTAKKIVELTVNDMKKQFSSNAGNIIAALGPTACGDCYEVGQDVYDSFNNQFPNADTFFKKSNSDGKYFFDCSKAAIAQLQQAGLNPTNIFISNYCTIHQNNLFFSYRKEGNGGKNKIGRQLGMIGRLS